MESKAISAMAEIRRAQYINDLRAAGLHVCLLFDCGNPHLEIKRIVLGQ